MKIAKTIKSLLLSACTIFTVITFLMCALGTWLSDGKLATTFPALTAFFVFSLFISVLNKILIYKKLHKALRIAIHFLGSIACFYGIFVRLGSFSDKISGTLVMLILFSLVYALTALTVFFIGRARAGAKRDSEKYETQFNFDN